MIMKNKNLEFIFKEFPRCKDLGVESIFKFYSFDDPKYKQYFEDLFIKNRIYHSMPSQLNDPFECKTIYRKVSAQDRRRNSVKKLRSYGYGRRDAEEVVSNIMKDPEYLEKSLRNLNESFSKFRLASFTRSLENLLMWSHYAKSHTGFCVEFSCSRTPFSTCYEVKYPAEYTEVDPVLAGYVEYVRPMLEKGKVWEYEAEYRSIMVPEGQFVIEGCYYTFVPNLILSVYMGCNISEEHESELISMLAKRNFRVKLWKAKPSTTEYALDFVAVDY